MTTLFKAEPMTRTSSLTLGLSFALLVATQGCGFLINTSMNAMSDAIPSENPALGGRLPTAPHRVNGVEYAITRYVADGGVCIGGHMAAGPDEAQSLSFLLWGYSSDAQSRDTAPRGHNLPVQITDAQATKVPYTGYDRSYVRDGRGFIIGSIDSPVTLYRTVYDTRFEACFEPGIVSATTRYVVLEIECGSELCSDTYLAWSFPASGPTPGPAAGPTASPTAGALARSTSREARAH